jgi:hypothetical protein
MQNKSCSGTMKPTKIIFKREMRGNDRGVDLIKVHCEHIRKCHNETLCATIIN